MEVSAVCGTPPRTPPREEHDGENPNADEVQQEEEDEEQEEDEEEEEPERQKKIRGRRKWEVLQSWDRNALLDSEINAEVLRIATEKMEESGLVEWPSARSAVKTLGLWTLAHSYTRESGSTEVDNYYCPPHNRCGCPVQIRVSRNTTSVSLKYSGGEHTQERCHQVDKFVGITIILQHIHTNLNGLYVCLIVRGFVQVKSLCSCPVHPAGLQAAA